MMFGIQWVLSDKVAFLLFGWRNWLGKHSSNIWNFGAHMHDEVSMESVTAVLLRRVWDLLSNWSPCCFILCMIGLRHGVLPTVLPFLISNYLRSSNWFSCIFFKVLYVHHCEHRVFLFFCNKILILIPPKKKKKICFSFFWIDVYICFPLRRHFIFHT